MWEMNGGIGFNNEGGRTNGEKALLIRQQWGEEVLEGLAREWVISPKICYLPQLNSRSLCYLMC